MGIALERGCLLCAVVNEHSSLHNESKVHADNCACSSEQPQTWALVRKGAADKIARNDLREKVG